MFVRFFFSSLMFNKSISENPVPIAKQKTVETEPIQEPKKTLFVCKCATYCKPPA